MPRLIAAAGNRARRCRFHNSVEGAARAQRGSEGHRGAREGPIAVPGHASGGPGPSGAAPSPCAATESTRAGVSQAGFVLSQAVLVVRSACGTIEPACAATESACETISHLDGRALQACGRAPHVGSGAAWGVRPPAPQPMANCTATDPTDPPGPGGDPRALRQPRAGAIVRGAGSLCWKGGRQPRGTTSQGQPIEFLPAGPCRSGRHRSQSSPRPPSSPAQVRHGG